MAGGARGAEDGGRCRQVRCTVEIEMTVRDDAANR